MRLYDFERRTKAGAARRWLAPRIGVVLPVLLALVLVGALSPGAMASSVTPLGPSSAARPAEAAAPSLLAYSSDGSILAVAGPQGIDVHDAQTLQLSRHIDAGAVAALAFSSNDTTLAAGSSSGTIKLFDVSTGQSLSTIQGPAGGITSLAFSPDGQLLAGGSQDTNVRIWQASNGQLTQTMTGHTGAVSAVAFAPDGSLLASGSADGSVRIWRVTDGSSVIWAAGVVGGVTALTFSPTAADVAFGAGDGTVRLWEVSSGKMLLTLTGKGGTVTGVAFAPGAATLASSALDGTVSIWQVSDGSLLQSLHDLQGAVSGIAFRPNAATLTAVTFNGQLQSWSTSGAASAPRAPGVAAPITLPPAGAAPITLPPAVVAPPAPTDNAAFVADASIPDYTVLEPGSSFYKSWRLRNDGTSSWGPGYSLAFVSGNRLGAPSPNPAPAVAPGQSADVTVPMVAPSVPGTYRGLWQMVNPNGQPFGPRIWVLIQVPGPVLPPPVYGAPPAYSYVPQLGISASSPVINAGSQVTIQAFVHNVQAAWVNGDPVVNDFYQNTFTLCSPTTFTLDTQLRTGEHVYRSVTVNVNGGC